LEAIAPDTSPDISPDSPVDSPVDIAAESPVMLTHRHFTV
jgi:hypothetical protein